MNTDKVVFTIKETGSTYRYTQEGLDIVADNYYIMTNINKPGIAADYMDFLLCCIGKNEQGQSMTISLNEKTRCYDISIALNHLFPPCLIFKKQELQQVYEMTADKKQQLYRTAENTGYMQMEKFIK